MQASHLSMAMNTAKHLLMMNPNLTPIAIIDRLVRELGAHIDWTPFSSHISGFLWFFEGSRPVIVLNSNHPDTRQLFSLAHELYHCLAGHEGGLSYGDPFVSQRPEEQAANRFAACILMPDWGVRQIIAAHGTARDVAGRFGVSIEAAESRIREVTERKTRQLASTGRWKD